MSDWSGWTRPTGWLLVLLTTLLLLVMPVTEHLCNWDHFLRGGQDVEFNLLAALLFAAMVVLSTSGSTMQPLMMQPSFVAMNCSRNTMPQRRLNGQAFPRREARVPSGFQHLDDPSPVCGPGTLTPLRI